MILPQTLPTHLPITPCFYGLLILVQIGMETLPCLYSFLSYFHHAVCEALLSIHTLHQQNTSPVGDTSQLPPEILSPSSSVDSKLFQILFTLFQNSSFHIRRLCPPLCS